MNYKIIYDNLIKKALSQNLSIDIYSEKHHIIPKCIGGNNDISNIVRLTARQHFIAHLLLAKIYANTGLIHAAFKMACLFKSNKKVKINSKTYEMLRIKHAHRVSTDEISKSKKSISHTGEKHNLEHVKNRILSRKNNSKNWHSNETIIKIKIANTGKPAFNKNIKLDENGIKKHMLGVEKRFANGSYKVSDETRRLRSIALKGVKKSKYTLSEEQKIDLTKNRMQIVACPFCVKEGAKMVMNRWHFNNCKQKGL